MFHCDKYLFKCLLHFISIVLILKCFNFIFCSSINSCFLNLSNLAVSLFLAIYTFEFTKRIFWRGKISPHGKAVLITGASSGFGLDLAKRLDKIGFHVFATCRSPSCQGAQELKDTCSERLKIVQLDVTKDESVKDASQFVTDNLGNLQFWAVVNNAGNQTGFIVDFSTLQDFKDDMDVNCFGMIRVTKAFLPLLKQSKGRIINLTSLAVKFPFCLTTPYCTSKSAAAGFSDCLRQEMETWGIRVIQVQPDVFKTRITDHQVVENRLESSFANIDPKCREEYGEIYFTSFRSAMNQLVRTLGSSNIYRVTDDLESAIILEFPDYIYKPTRNNSMGLFMFILEILPTNIWHLLVKLLSYSFSFPKPIKA